MKSDVFWDATLSNPIEIQRRFWATYYFHLWGQFPWMYHFQIAIHMKKLMSVQQRMGRTIAGTVTRPQRLHWRTSHTKQTRKRGDLQPRNISREYATTRTARTHSCHQLLLNFVAISHFPIRVPWDSWPHFTVSDSRLPFSLPPTTRRATVEVFESASTRD
jgi:hypothetical protein